MIRIFVTCVLFCFIFSEGISQEISTILLKKNITAVDSLIKIIDSDTQFIASNAQGGCSSGRTYNAKVYKNSISDYIQKVELNFALSDEQNVLYCRKNNLVKIRMRQTDYYYINNCFYDKMTLQQVYDEIFLDFKEIVRDIVDLFSSDR